jgi:hypothetical protein
MMEVKNGIVVEAPKKLLPCPFCGSQAKAIKTMRWNSQARKELDYYTILCNSVSERDGSGCHCTACGLYSRSIYYVIMNWNTRTPERRE